MGPDLFVDAELETTMEHLREPARKKAQASPATI